LISFKLVKRVFYFEQSSTLVFRASQIGVNLEVSSWVKTYPVREVLELVLVFIIFEILIFNKIGKEEILTQI